jgi:hypothetical protein
MSAPLIRPSDRTFSFARHALVEAFRLAGCNGSEILIPEFICRDVLAAVHAAGAIPRYYQVNEDLQPVRLPESAGVRAVLAVNYFGIPQDLEVFRAYCSGNGAVLIEDNAHGFLGSDGNGALLGTRGDLGVTSYRKTIRVLDGAQLYVNNERFIGQTASPLLPNEQRDPLSFRIRRTTSHIERRTGIPFFSTLQYATRIMRRLRTGSSLPISDPMSEISLPGTANPTASSLQTIRTVNTEHEIARRRRLFEEVASIASTYEVRPIIKHLSPGASPYGYPFIASSKEAARVRKAVSRFHVETMSWPDLPSAVNVEANHFYRNVWVVNFL